MMQGVKMQWKLKQLLNPAQVFDLMTGGPKTGYLPTSAVFHTAMHILHESKISK